MTDKEKEAQLAEVDATRPEAPNDAAIMNPEFIKFSLTRRVREKGKMKIETRDYEIYPMPLSKMRNLVKMSKVNIHALKETDFDILIDCIKEIAGETDAEFVNDSLTVPKIQELFNIVAKLNYSGIPSGDEKKKDGRPNGVKG